MAYSYGALNIRVTADTRDLRVSIARDATAAGNDAAKQISKSMGGGLSGLGQVAKATGQAVATGLTIATAAAVGFGVQSFRAAARAGEMDATLRALAKANNLNYDAMQSSVKEVRRFGIETGVAQNLVAQFARNQLDLTKSTDLARVAQDAAVISGENSSEVLDKLIHGITTQNSLVLRNAGVNVQAGQAIDKYAKSVGKSVRDLTDAERAQAVLNAVLEAGVPIAGAYEAAMREPGKVLRSYPRVVNDAQVAIGQGLVKAMGQAIIGGYDLVKVFSQTVEEGGALRPVVDAVGQAFGRVIAPITTVAEKSTAWLKALRPEQVDGIARSVQRLGPFAIVAAGGIAAMVAPQILRGVPGLGQIIGNLAGPFQQVGKLAGSAALEFVKVNGVSGAMSKAIGAVTSPVGLLVAGFALLMMVSPEFRRAVMDIVRALASALMPVLGAIVSAFKVLVAPLIDVATIMGGALAIALRAVVPLIQVLGAVLRLLAPVLPVIVLGFIAYKVAVAAIQGVQLAVAVATKIWTAAQWLLNIALNANPIALVVIAIAALIAAIVIAYQRVGWFRSIIDALWRAITVGAQAVLSWLRANWPLIFVILTGPFGFAVLLIARHWDSIKNATSAATSWIFGVVSRAWSAVTSNTAQKWRENFGWVNSAWNQIGQRTSGAIGWMVPYLANAWAAIGNTARTAWTGIVNSIGEIFGRLREAVRAPVAWVVNNVINKLIGGINFLLDAVGIGKITPIPGFAGGGKIPGHGRGDRYPIMAEAGEWMLTKRQARAIGYGNLARLPRYQEGGPIGIAPAFGLPWKPPNVAGFVRGAWDKAWGFTKEVTRLEDIANLGKEVVGYMAGMLRRAAAEAFKLLVAPLRKIAEGVANGPAKFPGQWLGKLAISAIDKAVEFIEGKVEPDFVGGAGIEGLVAEVLQRFPGLRITSALRPGDKGYHGRNMARDLGGPVGLMDQAARWIGEGMYRELLEGIFNPSLSVKNGAKVSPSFWGAGTWAGHRDHIHMAAAEGGPGMGPVGGGVQRWRPLVTQIAGMLGIGHTVDAWMRQIQSESGGNASIVQQIRDINWPNNLARGLLQVIPTTFAAQRGNPFGGNIMDPRANIWAAMKYAIGRYGSRLLSVIGRGHGYAGGGWISEPVIGLGLRSGTPYSFAEHRPEYVSPLGGQTPDPEAARRVTVNVYPQAGQDELEIAAGVSRELAWATAGGTL